LRQWEPQRERERDRGGQIEWKTRRETKRGKAIGDIEGNERGRPRVDKRQMGNIGQDTEEK
jgi:hypothetical protein